MNKKIPIILDGDPGHDDAIAWVLAGANKNFDILAVTTVCGNQTIEKTTYNARRILSLIDLEGESNSCTYWTTNEYRLFSPFLSSFKR